ncbi:MAG: hypothetical protein RIF33_06940 [Cyclobacteriaceae bacterium]
MICIRPLTTASNILTVLIVLWLTIFVTSCGEGDDLETHFDPSIIHNGLADWDSLQSCRDNYYFVALLSDRWMQGSTFNTDLITKPSIVKNIEIPIRMWDGTWLFNHQWDGSPGTLELSIIEGIPSDTVGLWNNSIVFQHLLDSNSIKSIVPDKDILLQPNKEYSLIIRGKLGIGAWVTTCNTEPSSIGFQYDQVEYFWYNDGSPKPFRITVTDLK